MNVVRTTPQGRFPWSHLAVPMATGLWAMINLLELARALTGDPDRWRGEDLLAARRAIEAAS